MTQQALIFDGPTFEPARDGERLTIQLERVRSIVSDGRWITLAQLARRAGGSEASVSARLRDLRKFRHGSHTIERRYVENGVWEYRMADLNRSIA